MLEDIWPADLSVLFVGLVATEPSPTLGFHHLHPRDRFWELLELSSISAGRVISKEERKAMAEGHARGSITDPVRQIFLQKKTSQLVRQGIGLTYLSPASGCTTEKEKNARPTGDDVRRFLEGCAVRPPRMIGFVLDGPAFEEILRPLFPALTSVPGQQKFTIGSSEVWLLGSTQVALKGEALLAQEDLFFACGERRATLRTGGSAS